MKSSVVGNVEEGEGISKVVIIFVGLLDQGLYLELLSIVNVRALCVSVRCVWVGAAARAQAV